MIKVPFALFAACSLASTAFAVDPTPVPKSTPAPAKAAPAKVAAAPVARPAPLPAYRAPAPAPVRVQTGPTAQQQAASAAEMAKAKARVTAALPATGPVVTPSTRTVSSSIAEANKYPTGPTYGYRKPATVPSPVNRMNPTNDPTVAAGVTRQRNEYAARQAKAAQAQAAQAAADKAKADKAKRQMWDKPSS